jgi:hypothetical protein
MINFQVVDSSSEFVVGGQQWSIFHHVIGNCSLSYLVHPTLLLQYLLVMCLAFQALHSQRSYAHIASTRSVLRLFFCSSRSHSSMAEAAARQASMSAGISAADLQSFSEYLQGCTHIMALLGAGLSASSGLPTFRGAGGLWRSHEATSLATPGAFSRNPGLVWQFYSYRRHMALNAKPNRAHYALAELARRNKNFITLSQNVDGILFNYPHLKSYLGS